VTTGKSGPFFDKSVGRKSVNALPGPTLFCVVIARLPFFEGSPAGNMPKMVGPTGDVDMQFVGGAPAAPVAPPEAAALPPIPLDAPPEAPPLEAPPLEAPPIGGVPPMAGTLPPVPTGFVPPLAVLV
jgi:hypothetical protein